MKKSGAAGAAVAGSWRAVTVLKAAVAAHAAWLAASACAFPFANGAPMGLGARGPVKVALEVRQRQLRPCLPGRLPQEQPAGPDRRPERPRRSPRLRGPAGDCGRPVRPDQDPEVVKHVLADGSVKLLVGPSFAGRYLGAKADCINQWASAVQVARTFDGTEVVKAWQTLDIPASDSVLGVRERFSPSNHDAVSPDGLCLYQWMKTGDRWWLRQVAPATS